MPALRAQVYKGIWQGNTPVAVKFVTGHSPKERARFRNEVAILQSLRHVNIVQFLGASLAGDQIMLVTEYMPRGDLWRALSQDSAHHFAWRNMCAAPLPSNKLQVQGSAWRTCTCTVHPARPWTRPSFSDITCLARCTASILSCVAGILP